MTALHGSTEGRRRNRHELNAHERDLIEHYRRIDTPGK
jgi:hypothetical protein